MPDARAQPPAALIRRVRISGPSPFAACPLGDPGTLFVHAEVEPWAAVNPMAQANIIAVWQQDRWSNGGARGLVAGFTCDGGRTWARTPLPFTAGAPGGLPYERATDPWVAFGPDGTAYATSISFSGPFNDARASALAAAVSRDGGHGWENVRLIRADGPDFLHDKAAVTADPTCPGVAYVVWRIHDRRTGTIPAWFARTTNHGRTWSTPRLIFDPGAGHETQGSQLLVDPGTGLLYHFFNWVINQHQPAYHVALQTSADGGLTWSPVHVIARIHPARVTGPRTGAPVRTAPDIPEPALDPYSGSLYVVWEDARFSDGALAEVAITRSRDGGRTWSRPTRVNTPTGRPAFVPAVRVNDHGVVGVTYYDLRHCSLDSDTQPTDYWLALSADGGTTFGTEVHVAGPFDLSAAPYTTGGETLVGHMAGDYQALVTTGTDFQAIFMRAHGGQVRNPTDIYAATIALGEQRT